MGLTLATFNVKDLLEPRVEAKLDSIAAMIARCDADLVGLQEIGPPALLEAVLDRLPEVGGVKRGGYGESLVGTADARGIRCAVVSRLPLQHREVHTADALPFPRFYTTDPAPFGTRIPLRRGIVHARVEAAGVGAVDVFVGHFKSSRPVPSRDAGGHEQPPGNARGRSEGTVRGLVWRIAEALFVRGLVDAVIAARGAGSQVAVLGDLNDLPDSTALRVLRGDGPEELLDCAAHIDPAARYSALHDGRRIQIDHVLATRSLHERLTAAEFLNAELRQHDPVSARSTAPTTAALPAPLPLPLPVPTIDSDHAPLVARFG